MPPAWNPDDVTPKTAEYELDENGKRKKYRPNVPWRLQVYLVANSLITLVLFVIMLINKDFPLVTKIQLMSLIVISVVSFGPLLERKKWGVWFDYLKLALLTINIPILFWNIPNASIIIIAVLAIVTGLFIWLQTLRKKVIFS